MELLSTILIGISIVIMTCGMIGLLRSKDFYHRLLVCALVDTSGLLVMLIGLALRAPTVSIALKILMLVLAIFLTAPLISHKLGRSSYISGHRGNTEEIHE